MKQPRVVGTAISGALASLALMACTSKPPADEPSTYGARYSSELEHERAEFVYQTQERIDKLDREIRQLQVRVDGESPYVSADQRAEWRQDLFELEQERRASQAELDRARTASPAEWRLMRSSIGAGVDRIEAAVGQAGYAIRTAFSREQTSDEAAAGQQSGAVPEDDNSVDDHATPGEQIPPQPENSEDVPPPGAHPYK